MLSIVNKILNLPFPVLNHWGYWIILFAATFEASPLLGLLVPGELIVIAGGFLVKIGVLDIGDTLFVATLGSILGDLGGYFLGKKYGYSLISRYGKYFFLKKERFEKARELLHRHSGKTLILGRFNSLTRQLAPLAAGSTNIPFTKFIIYNIIGAISWAISFVMLGYIFGRGYEITSKYIGKFIFIAIGLSIIIIYLYRFINKRKHIFTKYHLYALILNISSLYLFSKLLEDVISGESIIKLDVWLNAKMVILQNPLLNQIMIFITNVARPFHLFILALILFVILVYKKKWYYSLLLFFTMVSGSLSELLIKLIIQRARPENALIEVSGYSFPSGHATTAIIFFSLVIYFFKDGIKSRALKNIFILGNLILFLIIGFSRIYLNVHWFSDVVAGFSLGLFWFTLFILIFKTIISLSGKTLKIIKTL